MNVRIDHLVNRQFHPRNLAKGSDPFLAKGV
jgi:hypothetical protein